jgi:hypothetical protein
MRSIFDQYDVPENRLTHAMVCCLAEDRRLAAAFIRWVAPELMRGRIRLRILEQQVPGQVATDEEQAKGLPDAWLFDPDGDWALLVESKIASSVGIDQLRRHLNMARRCDFRFVRALLITTGPCRLRLPRRVIHKTWSELYTWFGRRVRDSQWAWRLVDYMRAAEARLVAEGYLMAGTLTRFDGLHFDDEHPYTAREGRRLIRLLRQELVTRPDLRALIDPKLPGRSAITGRGSSGVWDFIWLKAARGATAFTEFPHLTLALHPSYVEVAVTLPNGLRSEFRRRLISAGPEVFRSIIKRIRAHMEPIVRRAPSATPRIRLNQRHFLYQNSQSKTDAELDFDLRTAFRPSKGRIKYQPQWLDATFEVIKRRKSNLQMQVWLRIPYVEKITDNRGVLDLIAEAWLACRPLIDAVLQD